MRSRHLLAALGAAITIIPAGSASASSDAVCLVDAPVRITDLRIVQVGAAYARCAGSIGGRAVDPLANTPVTVRGAVRGAVRRSRSVCAPFISRGRIALEPMRLVSLDPDPTVRFTGTWRATQLSPVATTLVGAGSASGVRQTIAGAVRYLSGAGCSSGRLQMELLLD